MQGAAIDDEAVWEASSQFTPIVGPIGEDTVDRLLHGVRLREGARILDLGGRRSEWLLRALEIHPGATGEAIEFSAAHADATRAAAKSRGLDNRISVRVASAGEVEVSERYDLVLAVWAVIDVMGGFSAALGRLRSFVRQDGTAIVGVGVWEKEPTAQTLDVLEVPQDAIADLHGTVQRASAAGWLPVQAHVSTRSEWDGFMWSCVAGLAQWAQEGKVGAAERRGGPEVLRYMADYRDSWLTGFRGVLGFATVVMRPLPRWGSFLAQEAAQALSPRDPTAALAAQNRVLAGLGNAPETEG